MSVVVVEVGIHTAHQVGVSVLQVVEGILCGFQLDDIRNVKFLALHSEQVDIVAYRIAVLVEKRVGPQIPCVFIY